MTKRLSPLAIRINKKEAERVEVANAVDHFDALATVAIKDFMATVDVVRNLPSFADDLEVITAIDAAASARNHRDSMVEAWNGYLKVLDEVDAELHALYVEEAQNMSEKTRWNTHITRGILGFCGGKIGSEVTGEIFTCMKSWEHSGMHYVSAEVTGDKALSWEADAHTTHYAL